MKILKEKHIKSDQFVGIVAIKEWLSAEDLTIQPACYADMVVIGIWTVYHDGVETSFEGKCTLAICKPDIANYLLENYFT